MIVDDAVLDRAEEILGYEFQDRSLLATALTHASIADTRVASNERLEFLGDAVLGFLVCEALYRRFDDLLEGDLTKIKSAVVSRRMCATIAREMGLDETLVLGKGMKTRARLPSSLAAAVLESVIGAIFLDAGVERAREFVIDLLEGHIEAAAVSGHQQNFKSVLQQHAQSMMLPSPEYLLLDEKGPDHAKCFEVCVAVDGIRYGSCWAPSKKQAEQQAALVALETLGLIVRTEGGDIIYVPADEDAEAEAELAE